MNRVDRHIDEIAQILDISPTDYRRAMDRFDSVSTWLDGGEYQSGSNPIEYLQGSFRLGTVVRPYRNDREGEYDIDLVCELTTATDPRSPEQLKYDIGDRLREHADYRRMLDDEGKRCWTVEYATEENRPGFHIDILPAVPSVDGAELQIDITNRENRSYYWTVSNPRAYYQWFKSRNPLDPKLVHTQRAQISASNKADYGTPDTVPKRLVRTSMQRGIQILKRHRDVYFSASNGRPPSILVTTLVAHQGLQPTVLDTVLAFSNYVIRRHSELLASGSLSTDYMMDYANGAWHIPSPVTFGRRSATTENFADRWATNRVLSKKFFQWVYRLDRDIKSFRQSGISDDLHLRIKRIGQGPVYTTILRNAFSGATPLHSNSTTDLLQLIHLGIDGLIDWDYVRQMALDIVHASSDDESKSVAKVNYYQVALHRGIRLSQDAKDDVRTIAASFPSRSDFQFCCSLLLGQATNAQLRALLTSNHQATDVLRWPILRLAPDNLLFP